MGDDTLYSGTVAAATEGYLLGVPAIAVSLVGREFAHYGTAARVARELVERIRRAPPARADPAQRERARTCPTTSSRASRSRGWGGATRRSRW